MLLDTLQSDLITAMKAGDKPRVETLRFLISAVKKYEIDTYLPGSNKTLTDDDVKKIVARQVKTHRESIEAFEKGNRPELAEKEKHELEILQTYMPKELTDEEIRTIALAMKSRGVPNFGAAMGMVMKEVAGRADGNRVSAIVREVLG